MAGPAKGTLSPDGFLTAVRKGTLFPVVLLRGNEEFLLRQSQDEYVKQALDPAAADFDYNEFRSGEVSGEMLWNALTTLPLMAKHRLVVLEMTGEPKREIAEVMSRYLARPAPTTLLLMVAVEGGLGRGMELPPTVTDVEFRILRESERQQWAAAYVQRRGKKVERDALSYLVETSAGNLADIAAKLDHAILYLGEEAEITTRVLMTVAGVSSEYTVFNLEDAILERDAVKAHKIARSLLQGGEVLLRLLSFHRGMVLKLWQVSAMLKKPDGWHRSPEGQEFWEKVLRRASFKQNIYLKAAREMGIPKIRAAVTGLLELEVAAKTGTTEPFRYYEWIWNITSDPRKQVEPVFQPKS